MNLLIHPFALVILLATFGAAAQERDTSVRDAQAQTPAAAVDARSDCLRYTGSRIRADRHAQRGAAAASDRRIGCIAAPGRSYSRDDLNSTGAMDVGDALRRLDPAIR